MKTTEYKTTRKFPSPIGELHFSINCKRYINLIWHTVSVPYRGATFLNHLQERIQVLYLVSVPYRGATFLNTVYCPTLGNLFTVSVPYRGATFLNLILVMHSWFLKVSVPYRGATFLNTIPATPCPVWDE